MGPVFIVRGILYLKSEQYSVPRSGISRKNMKELALTRKITLEKQRIRWLVIFWGVEIAFLRIHAGLVLSKKPLCPLMAPIIPSKERIRCEMWGRKLDYFLMGGLLKPSGG